MKAWLSFVLLLCYLSLYTQETGFNATGKYLTIGIGIPINTVRDQAHSPLSYRGKGIRLFTTYERIKADNVFRVHFSLDDIKLKARISPRQDIRKSAKLTDMQLGFGYYRRLGDTTASDNQQYLGAAYTIQINAREYPLPTNNSSGIIFRSSLSAGIMDKRAVGSDDKWSATTIVDLPLITTLYRPSYIGIPPFLHLQKVKGKDFFNNFEIVTLNRFFKLSASLDFDHQSRAWRTDRLSYDWNLLYTPLPLTKPMISTTSSLAYGFRVLL